jgi:hypothetical protein
MSSQTRASNFKPNVVPKRMDGYVDRRDLETYLTDRWPNVDLKEFKIRASSGKAGYCYSLTLVKERDERISFVAPEEVTKADYEKLIASAREGEDGDLHQ